MFEVSTTPTIEVRIGRQTRLYHAFITTAPATLDAPSTLTLHAGVLKDVASLAVEDLPADVAATEVPARLVLIDTTELDWQRDRCKGQGYRLAIADAVVVGTALRFWLSRRPVAIRTARRTPHSFRPRPRRLARSVDRHPSWAKAGVRDGAAPRRWRPRERSLARRLS